MAEPTSKQTRRTRGNRRSHSGITAPGRSECPNCGALVRPHNACGTCGFYKGREVIAQKNN